MVEHWFWLLLSCAAVGWYAFVTSYVAVRGVKDIKDMLSTLDRRKKEAEAAAAG
jgi:hypothetical protein